MDFEKIIDAQLPFIPSFIEESEHQEVKYEDHEHARDERWHKFNNRLYKQRESNHYLSIADECYGTQYTYFYYLDGGTLAHRFKGPQAYMVDNTGELRHLQFWLYNKSFEERDYWNYLAFECDACNFDIGTDNEGKVVKEVYWFGKMEIWYYSIGKKVYRINKKTVTRSMWYRVLERRKEVI